MQIQKLILKSEVIDDFEILINPYCEQFHIITGTARPKICKIMVDEFSNKINHKKDWIRKKIEIRYKPPHRVRNGKLRSDKSRINKIPEKINKLEAQFSELTKVAIDYAKKG